MLDGGIRDSSSCGVPLFLSESNRCKQASNERLTLSHAEHGLGQQAPMQFQRHIPKTNAPKLSLWDYSSDKWSCPEPDIISLSELDSYRDALDAADRPMDRTDVNSAGNSLKAQGWLRIEPPTKVLKEARSSGNKSPRRYHGRRGEVVSASMSTPRCCFVRPPELPGCGYCLSEVVIN